MDFVQQDKPLPAVKKGGPSSPACRSEDPPATRSKCPFLWKRHLGKWASWESPLLVGTSPQQATHKTSKLYSLPELLNFKNLFGKTILVVKKRFGLFLGHPLWE